MRIDPPTPLPALVALTAPPGGSAPITIVALAHCENLLAPFLEWSAALALQGLLTKRDHEIVALRTAHNCRSDFEWNEHSRFARAAGLTDDEIGRIATGPDADWNDREQLLLAAADELHNQTSISSRTWTALGDHFTIAEVVEAIYVVGQYTMLSMVANVVEGDNAGGAHQPMDLTQGLHHVAINVDDISAADHFYGEVLGLTQVDRPDLGINGSWFEAPNGLQVHLVELPGGGCDSNHMAFAVADIDDALAEVRARGWEAKDWTDIGTGRQTFLRDPSGNIVELNQQV